jgi:hypothetical protein
MRIVPVFRSTRGGHAGGFGVLAAQFAEVFVNAGFDFLQECLQLFLGVVAARVVDRFEFAAVEGDELGAEEAPLAAEPVELFEAGFEGGAVVLAKVGDGFEVGAQAAQPPDQFEAAAGANAVEVAVEVKLEPVGGVIGWPAGGGGLGALETQGAEVEPYLRRKLILPGAQNPHPLGTGNG